MASLARRDACDGLPVSGVCIDTMKRHGGYRETAGSVPFGLFHSFLHKVGSSRSPSGRQISGLQILESYLSSVAFLLTAAGTIAPIITEAGPEAMLWWAEA